MLTVHFLMLRTLLIKLLKPSFLRKLFTLLKEINLGLITSLKFQFVSELDATNVGVKPTI